MSIGGALTPKAPFSQQHSISAYTTAAYQVLGGSQERYYKTGDKSDPTNWRPIALGCTISKVYSSRLYSRMQQWVCDGDVLRKCQKGFLPFDEVYEHNFILQKRLDAVRTGRGDICMAFLDFANAFGSVAHNASADAVRYAGAGETFTAIVQDLYRENAATITAEGGFTDPITIAACIRQGCPLSGLLFNMVIDPIIRAVQGGAGRHAVFAYADECATLQMRINTINTIRINMAVSALTDVVTKRMRRPDEQADIEAYLAERRKATSGQPPPR